MLPEKSQKCKGLLADTHHGILHLFGRDKSQITLYTLIMPFDFFSQIIYSSVDDKSIPTTPVSPSFSGFHMAGLTDTFVPICTH